MNHSFIALAFQETVTDFPTWIIIAVVLVLLFFVVVVIAIGLAIFFVMRKRSRARAAAVASAVQVSSGPSPAESIPPYSEEPAAPVPEVAVAVDAPPPVFETPTPMEEIKADVAEVSPAPLADSGAVEFDPSRTVAITRENTVAISYGYINFVSGVLAGQQFEIQPEGAYIGRESSLSQIVVADPRISKRHLWIGVKDGQVKIADQDSRNGTFVNDPRSERVTEATLNDGDTIILGESDVARFEYHS
jgi:hypothetical protein